MLVLSRKINEEIVIGDNIRVRLVKVGGGRARLGISAPPEITVRRAELARKASSESALNHGGGLAVEQVATADW